MPRQHHPTESPLGTVLGWGALAVFAAGFAWYVGAPLLIGERWADKDRDAIELVKNQRPTGGDTLYDLVRAYSLRAKAHNRFVGEITWSAMQREGPEYEVTLLWTEDQEKKLALWRVNLENKEVRPQGNEAAGLPRKLTSGPTEP
jgi:hypothetical protein